MSKTNKIRRLENQCAQAEVKNQMLIEENAQVKLENYRLKEELKLMRQDLEVVKMAFDKPANLQNQAY